MNQLQTFNFSNQSVRDEKDAVILNDAIGREQSFTVIEVKGAKMKSHAAKADKSTRLQKLLSVLQRGGIFSTARLHSATGSMAVHTDIHELRCNGYKITRHYIGRVNNRSVYGYKLEG